MATKKNSTIRALSKPTPKGRKSKDPKANAVPDAAPTPPEPAPAQADGTPTPEPSSATTPAPVKADAPASVETLPEQTTRTKKPSVLDAAAQVLGETGQAMSCPELIAAMTAKGYWRSPKGRTPASTPYSAVLRELKTKGDKAPFRKTARSQFALRRTV
jgi:hypothetical protein